MNWPFHLDKGIEVRDRGKVTRKVNEVCRTLIKENKIGTRGT